jgi:hypothetical protein
VVRGSLGEFRLGTFRETPQQLNCNPRHELVTCSFFTISMERDRMIYSGEFLAALGFRSD